jgi:large subunit ribosomal protein L3
MKFILGTKLGMSQIFDDNGRMIPVTLIEAGPMTVTQIRTNEKDGYSAVQVGYQTKKTGKGFKHLREFRIEDEGQYKTGDVIDVSVFSEKDLVRAIGTSKGKGFAGVMKRHNFSGMPASHGHKHVARHGGSIGQRFPQRTLKGMKMPGHMGAKQATVRGLTVVKIDKEKNMLLIRGAVPGIDGKVVEIREQ